MPRVDPAQGLVGIVPCADPYLTPILSADDQQREPLIVMMQKYDHEINQHYQRGDLETIILAALQAAGKDLEQLTPDDLAPLDQFRVHLLLGTESSEMFRNQIRNVQEQRVSIIQAVFEQS